MDKKFYCCNCETMQLSKVIEKEQTFNVKGRSITLKVLVRVCEKCGEEIFDEELDSIALNLFYNEYRTLENLLLPEEIKSIRQKYNLSQSSFAKFLGFGEKTITRYENGSIQDVCHDNLIRLMKSMDSLALLWEKRKNCLSIKEQNHIESILSTYKKTKIKSIYNPNPIYSSSCTTMFMINQGDLSYAG